MIFGRTGEQCSIAGKYSCFGNNEEQVNLQQGDFFPKAGASANAFWILSGKMDETGMNNNTQWYKEDYQS